MTTTNLTALVCSIPPSVAENEPIKHQFDDVYPLVLRHFLRPPAVKHMKRHVKCHVFKRATSSMPRVPPANPRKPSEQRNNRESKEWSSGSSGSTVSRLWKLLQKHHLSFLGRRKMCFLQSAEDFSANDSISKHQPNKENVLLRQWIIIYFVYPVWGSL